MPENTLFIDSSAWLALYAKDDQHHQPALKIWKQIPQLGWPCYTSNYIFHETLTLISSKKGQPASINWGKYFLENIGHNISYKSVLPEDEHLAWQLFQKFPEPVSFTDCTCWALMKRHKITQVFTFDTHFSQAGFEVMP
jgi:uncharacterized protein